MGNILITDRDYDAIRYALGLEDDASRLITDNVIDALPHLPAAELEAIRRFPSFWASLMKNDPKDFNQQALKMGTVAKCCANLCARLEITIPVKGGLDNLGEIERTKIDWLKKKTVYNNDANWFWEYLDIGLNPHSFPPSLATAAGKLYKFDPGYWKQFSTNPFLGVSDFGGYTAPSGIAYLS